MSVLFSKRERGVKSGQYTKVSGGHQISSKKKKNLKVWGGTEGSYMTRNKGKLSLYVLPSFLLLLVPVEGVVLRNPVDTVVPETTNGDFWKWPFSIIVGYRVKWRTKSFKDI